MNKTLMSVLAAGLLLAAPQQAQAGDYGMAGCGLGSLLITDKSAPVQLFVMTTNATSASQTLGITTGTSNCTADGVVMVDKEQEAFTELNFDALQQQLAQGSGEHLDAFVTLLGCSSGVKDEVMEAAQASYDTVFPTASTTPQQALYMLKLQLSYDHQIQRACTRI